eukprot:COSAG06_NODE_13950_length_1202_cov_2.407978_1_plen_124_part_10
MADEWQNYRSAPATGEPIARADVSQLLNANARLAQYLRVDMEASQAKDAAPGDETVKSMCVNAMHVKLFLRRDGKVYPVTLSEMQQLQQQQRRDMLKLPRTASDVDCETAEQQQQQQQQQQQSY